jgi:hypothetical protein
MKASKHRHRNINSKRKTRKIKGGSVINMSSWLCPGCRSDSTTAIGTHLLKTPLPDWPPSWNKSSMCGGGGGKRKGRGKKGGSGGFTCGGCGQLCNKSPLQFLQSGGGKSRAKKSRKMGGGGGGGGFWDFAKPFWNPSNPGAGGYENGFKVLAPSCKGISPSGLGSPVSTAGYQPDRKLWSAEFRNDKHLYQKGGGRSKGSKKISRKMKGGNIGNDIMNFGRTFVHGIGTTFNNFRGVSNDIYAPPPNPLFGQFPRGYGIGKNIETGKQFMDIKPFPLKNIYSHASSIAART